MPQIVRFDVHHDAPNQRVALSLGSEGAGSLTLVVTPQQAREIAAAIQSAASMAEGLLGLSGGVYASH